MKNKQGVTLIELLGALVVFGILITMSVMVIDYFIDANNRATVSAQANVEGLLAIRRTKNSIEDLEPTTFENCPGQNCLIVQKEYGYEYNEGTNSIDLVIYDTPEEYKIEISNDILYIDDVEYVFEGFELSSDSAISFVETDSILYITLTMYLTAGAEFTYEYVMTHSYELSDVPVT
jgi:prepilin-type N-terminal cleavage/methylation domain-containing protein